LNLLPYFSTESYGLDYLCGLMHCY